LGGEQELTAISSEKVPGTAAKGGSFTVTAHRAPPSPSAPPGFGARSAAFNNRRKRETKMRPIREEEDETRLRGRERERGRERTRKEELKQAQGRKKEKAGVVFDHYGVGFSLLLLLLPLLRRRSLPASPPSLLLLLLLNAVGGGLIWRGGHCSLLTPVPHGSHLSVAFTPSDAIMLTALSAAESHG